MGWCHWVGVGIHQVLAEGLDGNQVYKFVFEVVINITVYFYI